MNFPGEGHLRRWGGLGTRRMQVLGVLAKLAQPEMDFQSLPSGDGFSQFACQYADDTTTIPRLADRVQGQRAPRLRTDGGAGIERPVSKPER